MPPRVLIRLYVLWAACQSRASLGAFVFWRAEIEKMANPQLEDGYTRIANEIMEALAKYRIPGEQRQVLDIILRKTYGYGKKWDMISNSQFVKATGMKKGNASRAIKGLIDKNIVIKSDNKHIPSYQFNKNYKKWKVLSKKQPLSKVITGVIKSDNRLLSKVMDTKESITKESITKEKVFMSDSDEIRLSILLFDLMLENNPKTKTPNFNGWAEHIEKLIRIDNRNPEEIEHVIYWTQQDSFEMSNILSTQKLRKRFDQLWLKSNKTDKGSKIFTRNLQAMEEFINDQ